MQHDESLIDTLSRYAKEYPDHVTFCYLADGEAEEQPLTYRDFERQAQAIGAELQALGLEGERVLLLFPQGLEYLIALFGCFYAGAIAVPAYPPRNNRNLKRLLAIMDNCGAHHIMADQDGIQHIERMDRDFTDYQMLIYEEMLAKDGQWKPRSVKRDDIAYLQYTSGSTGSPKGVTVSHLNMLENIKGLKETYYPHDLKVSVSWIPMYHDMGLLSMMTAFTIQQATCYFMSPVHFVQKPVRWLQAISKYGAQYSVGPNFAFDLCFEKVSEEEMEGIDLSCLKSVTNGSEPVRLSTLLAFYEKFHPYGFDFTAFCPGYGLAEATLGVSVLGADERVQIVPKQGPLKGRFLDSSDWQVDDPDRYWVGCGHVVQQADVQIVSPQSGKALAEGQEGEIWIHHEGFVSKGYWDHPDANAKTFENTLPGKEGKRFLRTGDLGFLFNGQLFVTGRVKDMIIIRGENYYPQDIELVVNQAHETLEQNACAAFAHEADGQEQLIIVQEVKRTEWRRADPEAVVQAIRQQLSEEFEIAPRQILLIRPMSLPKTSSGKIQRFAARQQWENGELRAMHEWKAAVTAAETPIDEEGPISVALIQQRLREQIAEKAKMPLAEVTPDAAVKDFPLESIDAIFLSDELSEWLGLKLTPDTLWALGSIRELSEFLYRKYQEEQG